MDDLLTAVDPEAAAFFADARAALTRTPEPTPKPKPPTEYKLPADWPITPRDPVDTLTLPELHARRGHALRISHDGTDGRRVLWVGQWPGHGWSILKGHAGKPASLLTSDHTWAASVYTLNRLAAPGWEREVAALTVDKWLPEFITICRAHGAGCRGREGVHNFVQRRTLTGYPGHPNAAYPMCSMCCHDGIFCYSFQIHGQRQGRAGCRRHHAQLLDWYLREADGTVTVRKLNDHLDERLALALVDLPQGVK